MYLNLVVQFVFMGGVGLCFNSIFSISFQFGCEVTYPAPESTMTGLLSLTSHLWSLILTQAIQYGIEFFKESHPDIRMGSFFGIGTIVGLLVIGLILSIFIKEDRKRQRAVILASNNTSNSSLQSESSSDQA